MSTEVNLADVILLQDFEVTRVGSVMRCHVVNRATGGECNTSLEFVGLDELAVGGLDLIADVNQAHARLDDRLCEFTNLSVAFGCLTKSLVIMSEEALLLAIFSSCNPLTVLILVLKDLSFRELSRGELLSDRDCGRIGLLIGVFSFSFPAT